jgi:hypothetical protein
MDQKQRHVSTADLAAAGDELHGRGDERMVSRSARDAAETFIREDARGRDVAETPAARTPAARETAPSSAPPQPVQHERSARPELFPDHESDRLRTEWTDIQSAFVDSPRQAVQRADALVANAMQRMAAIFAEERAKIEQQWDRGDDVTTEDLRVVLQRYRSFFDRLLSA